MIARKTLGAALVALVAALAFSPTPAQAPAATETYIHAGRLLADPATGRIDAEQTIVVAAGKIARVEAGYTGAPGGSSN